MLLPSKCIHIQSALVEQGNYSLLVILMSKGEVMEKKKIMVKNTNKKAYRMATMRLELSEARKSLKVSSRCLNLIPREGSM